MEDYLKKIKKWKATSKKKFKKEEKKEDDLKRIQNGRRPQKKWKTNQSTKINLIGCDTIVNLPSLILNMPILFHSASLTTLSGYTF